jgi:serine/threonine protein kinase
MVKSRIIVGTVIGMKYVHLKEVIHRDVKPSNIFIDKQNQDVPIPDFGSCYLCSVLSALTLQVCAAQSVAPEMYKEGDYDFAVDVFLFGLILY